MIRKYGYKTTPTVLPGGLSPVETGEGESTRTTGQHCSQSELGQDSQAPGLSCQGPRASGTHRCHSGRHGRCIRRSGLLQALPLPVLQARRGLWPRPRAAARGPPPSPLPPRAWASVGAGTPWVRHGSPRCCAFPGPGAPGPAGPAAGAAKGSPRPGLAPQLCELGPTSSDRRSGPCRCVADPPAETRTLPGGMGATTVEGGAGHTKAAQKGGALENPNPLCAEMLHTHTQFSPPQNLQRERL